ncbi:MAG TPA: hypothetical protein VGN19_00570, partial [Pedococcus sp.]|nr:hypothetical protein [Pedococcus sp.]
MDAAGSLELCVEIVGGCVLQVLERRVDHDVPGGVVAESGRGLRLAVSFRVLLGGRLRRVLGMLVGHYVAFWVVDFRAAGACFAVVFLAVVFFAVAALLVAIFAGEVFLVAIFAGEVFLAGTTLLADAVLVAVFVAVRFVAVRFVAVR